MPNRIFIVGPDVRTHDRSPSNKRAAVVLEPLPFWWWGETEVLVPGPTGDSPVRHNIRREWLGLEGAHRDFAFFIRDKHPVMKLLDHHGWQVLEGDDVRALGEALSDVASNPETPGAAQLSLAGRMLERASRIPCKAVVDGE